MPSGFYIILAAQFFSALADNALLFAAIALLGQLHAPPEYEPRLGEYFVLSYILLAPFVGAFADAIPKGKVMFISNGIKLLGCIAMQCGVHPLLSYAVVGLGAAAYSPAKYGILTEYLPPQKLVLANGWMEGLTVLAIILGAVIGGYLLNPGLFAKLHFTTGMPSFDQALDTAPELAVVMVAGFYLVAALFNLYIPRVPIDHKLQRKNLLFLLHDFWHAFRLLWRDPLGQVSLAVTTLFWGTGQVLRFLVLAWAMLVLNFEFDRASRLIAWVAVGIAIGSVLAARFVTLEKSVKVLPVGIAMGFTVIAMVFVTNPLAAILLLITVGAMGGFFVVPMNALLQHRGHLLMGAGHSIAVQNFNENLSIFLLLRAYDQMIKHGLSVYTICVIFGAFIVLVMAWLQRKHRDFKPV
jgi:MFS transporter, LPLT family, lysophospholipid transporter